jgi:tetratricopeptide (TPR) repeat protein
MLKPIATLIVPLLGAMATLTLLCSPSGALRADEVDQIARQVTVKIDGQSPGSGVLLARQGQTYYVLTAAHVVPSPDEYEVITPDGQKHRIDYRLVKKISTTVDLALVQFSSPQNYRVAEIGNFASVGIGTSAFVTGFPNIAVGPGSSSSYRFADGRITAKSFQTATRGYALAYRNDTFSGMSGGPVLDQDGKLIGIHGASKSGFNETRGINPRTGIKFGFNLGIPVETFLRLSAQVTPQLKLPPAPAPSPSTQPTASDFFVQGLDQVIAGNNQAALKWLNEAIRLRPDYADAYFLRGNAQAVLRNQPAALADFTKALQLNPKDSFAYVNRGNIYADLKRNQQAIADYTQAVQINPQDSMAYNNRATVYFEAQDYSRAIADYDQAIRVNPSNVDAYYSRGLSRARAGDRPGAIVDYSRAIALDPKYAAAYYNRGVSQSYLGNPQAALRDYTAAIQADPKLADAYYNRALTRAQLGDRAGSIADYDQVLRITPNDSTVLTNRGVSRYFLGDKQGALADFNAALRANPEDALAYENRGLIRAFLGDSAGARTDYEKAAELARRQNNQKLLERLNQRLNER